MEFKDLPIQNPLDRAGRQAPAQSSDATESTGSTSLAETMSQLDLEVGDPAQSVVDFPVGRAVLVVGEDKSKPVADAGEETANKAAPQGTITPAYDEDEATLFSATRATSVTPGPFQFDQVSRTPNAILGRCFDAAGQPAPGVKISLHRIATEGASVELVSSTTSDTAGRFALSDILSDDALKKPTPDPRPGAPLGPTYAVVVQRQGVITRMFTGMGGMIARGVTATIRLEPSATLTGRVTDDDGNPVAGALVSAQRVDYLPKIEGVQSTRTDEDGMYEIADAVPFDLDTYRRAIANQPDSLTFFAVNEPNATNTAAEN